MIFDFLLRLFRTRPDVTQEPDEELDPFNPFPEPVVVELRDVIDLHSIPPRHVKAVVEDYLEQAVAKGFRRVRIIHGKGQGVQREMVRSILKRTPSVIEFRDAPPDYGGWGATIVTLEARSQEPE